MNARIDAVQPVLMARDVARSLRFYRLLGFHERFRDDPDAPRYAGVERDGQMLFLQWQDAAQWVAPVDRPTCRFLVSDVDRLFRELVASGAVSPETRQASPWGTPGDTPWGTREFHLLDPDGNGLQFYRPR